MKSRTAALRLRILALPVVATMLIGAPATFSQSDVSTSTLDTPSTAGWKFKNEQDWIVDSIARDIAEILCYSKYHKQADFKDVSKTLTLTAARKSDNRNWYSISLTVAGKQLSDFQLNLQDYLWSTKNFQPFAKQVISELELTPPEVPSKTPEDFLDKLANSDLSGLIKENERISKELSENPLDSGLHEQAAMLIARLSMIENSGSFYDYRAQLSRGCAHLSLAKALSKEKPSMVGQVADLALEMITGRDAKVMPQLEEFIKTETNPTLLSILRALKIRGTQNTNLYNEKDHTVMEEEQWFFRNCTGSNGNDMVTYLAKHHADRHVPPLFQMRCIADRNSSVEVGHVVAPAITKLEVQAFLEDYKAYNKVSDTSYQSIISDLNLTPDRCLDVSGQDAKLNPVSWNDLAAYHARHIMNAVECEYRFYEKSWGVPEQAQALIERSKNMFGKVALYPLLVNEFNVEGGQQQELVSEAAALCAQHPEIVTDSNWHPLQRTIADKHLHVQLIPVRTWFDPETPYGTGMAYMPEVQNDLAALTEIRNLCPYSVYIDRWYAYKKYGGRPTYAQSLEVYGPIMDYNTEAMECVAATITSEPDKFIPLYEKIAKTKPTDYFNLGVYCVLNGRPDAAAKYFELAVQKSDDDVLTSNCVGWLVNYRFDHKQQADAAKLASLAGEVYSGFGLDTLARYYERAGELAKAEKTYKDLDERYANKANLCAFYLRNAKKNPKYDAQGKILVKEFYPQGLRLAKLTDFKAPPAKGVIVTNWNWLAPKSPLVNDVIIVAVNGCAVETEKNFKLATNMSDDKTISAIYWNGKNYGEYKQPDVSIHRFSVNYKMK